MKQKIRICLIMSLAIFSVLGSVAVFSACDEHEHRFGEYDITLAATCETDGEKVHTCSICGYAETKVIPAGHDWSEFEIIKAADCEAKGERKRTCSICKYDDIEVLPANGHDWSEFTVTVPAKCDAAGKQTRTCSVCGDEDMEIISATEHNWSEFTVTIPAKCDEEGEQTRTCSACNKEEVGVVPALEHVWSEYKETPATCNEAGEKIRSCDLCHKEEREELSKLEHKWSDYIETLPASCDQVGEKMRICEVCKKEEKEELPKNDHQWSDYAIISPASCDQVGEKMRACEVCKEEEREELPKIDHTWSEFSVTTKPACEKKGEKIRTCEVCKKEERVELPALEHIWMDEVIIKDATCEEEGLRSVKCELCSIALSSDVIPALGHTKGRSIPLIAPTCEKEGRTQITCAVCQEVYYEYPPATGHNYSEEFTVDKAPTIYAEGEQSRHCTNYQCNSRMDIQSIPKLISEAYFRIYVVRGENQKLLPTTYNPMVKIANEQGSTVASGFAFSNANGEHFFEKILPFGTYTVTIYNDLPSGFECGEYTISEQNGTYPYDTPEKYPTITMHVYSHLGTGSMTNGDKKNTVLNDFSVTTIDGVKITLSELLAQKKLVWLNFYYNACSPCQSEAPEIIRIAKQFDVAVICFNNRDSIDDIRTGAKSIFKFPDSFYIVQDSGDAFGKLFGRFAYPLNVFIDSGGCVFESVTGSNYSSQFYNFIKDNLFTTPEKPYTVSFEFVELPAILPEKQRYLY